LTSVVLGTRDDFRVRVENRNALLDDRPVPIIVRGGPFVQFAGTKGEDPPEVPRSAKIPFVPIVPDPLVLRRELPADLLRPFRRAIIGYDEFDVLIGLPSSDPTDWWRNFSQLYTGIPMLTRAIAPP
jgi:hypothetical protein